VFRTSGLDDPVAFDIALAYPKSLVTFVPIAGFGKALFSTEARGSMLFALPQHNLGVGIGWQNSALGLTIRVILESVQDHCGNGDSPSTCTSTLLEIIEILIARRDFCSYLMNGSAQLTRHL
jgi:hypothetical protein